MFNKFAKKFLSHEIDMLHGSMWDKMIIFALPLAFTGVLQQLLNAADVAVLGQYVGKHAMAAVGNNISVIGLLVSLFMGLSLGANVVIAQNIGSGKQDLARQAIHTAFLFSFIVGLFAVVAGELMVNPFMDILGVPTEVADMAEEYLRIYLLGMPMAGVYNFEAAIFRSRGDTGTPLLALFAASMLNIVLNLVFVLHFSWGIGGVAAATATANTVSALILLVALCRADGIIRLNFAEMKITRPQLAKIVRIGLPAGIQGMVFSLSNLLIQSAINSLGADTMAASAAAFTIEINVFCFLNAFGQTATTFVGQNFGARNYARCIRATKTSLLLNAVFMLVLSVFILIFADPMLSFFNDDKNVVALGKIRILYVVMPEIINVFLEGLSGALRGYGVSMIPAALTLVGICGIRITWVYTLFAQTPTYEVLMATYPVSWLVTTIFIYIAYRFYIKHLFMTMPRHRQKEA